MAGKYLARLTEVLDETDKLSDVGRDILLVANTRLPSAVAADDEASPPGLVGIRHDD